MTQKRARVGRQYLDYDDGMADQVSYSAWGTVRDRVWLPVWGSVSRVPRWTENNLKERHR